MSKRIALGLGSNQGDRFDNLRRAAHALQNNGLLRAIRCSPVIETAAFLKPGAPVEWDVPFLNLVIEGETDLEPREFLRRSQAIEVELGRGPHEVWSPRIIDIDILSWGEERVALPDLLIPHQAIASRSFVLDPWTSLNPGFRFNETAASLLNLRRRIPSRQPILMGIVNITPDSFSDGGEAFHEEDLQSRIRDLLRDPPAIIDLGGQSTRPGAEIVGLDEEWTRIERALHSLDSLKHEFVRPWISIDTFRPEIAERAIDWGVEIINDVSGLNHLHMVELARAASDTHFIFMHHLGIPADRRQTLPIEQDPVEALVQFAETNVHRLEEKGVSPDRLIFDPGIGFGKRPVQSLALIARARELVERLDVRLLYGHSRKSYQAQVDPRERADRDAITLTHSLHLAECGVEFLRIHDVRGHRSALLTRDHLARQNQ